MIITNIRTYKQSESLKRAAHNSGQSTNEGDDLIVEQFLNADESLIQVDVDPKQGDVT